MLSPSASDAESNDSDRVLVFCLTKSNVEQVATQLRKRGIACNTYWSQKLVDVEDNTVDAESTNLLESVQQWLQGRVQVMVSTCALSCGVDCKSIRLVAHWRLPWDLVSWSQMVGRGGRDGRKTVCEVIAWSAEMERTHPLGDGSSDRSTYVPLPLGALELRVENRERGWPEMCRRQLLHKFLDGTSVTCIFGGSETEVQLCDVCVRRMNDLTENLDSPFSSSPSPSSSSFSAGACFTTSSSCSSSSSSSPSWSKMRRALSNPAPVPTADLSFARITADKLKLAKAFGGSGGPSNCNSSADERSSTPLIQQRIIVATEEEQGHRYVHLGPCNPREAKGQMLIPTAPERMNDPVSPWQRNFMQTFARDIDLLRVATSHEDLERLRRDSAGFSSGSLEAGNPASRLNFDSLARSFFYQHLSDEDRVLLKLARSVVNVVKDGCMACWLMGHEFSGHKFARCPLYSGCFRCLDPEHRSQNCLLPRFNAPVNSGICFRCLWPVNIEGHGETNHCGLLGGPNGDRPVHYFSDKLLVASWMAFRHKRWHPLLQELGYPSAELENVRYFQGWFHRFRGDGSNLLNAVYVMARLVTKRNEVFSAIVRQFEMRRRFWSIFLFGVLGRYKIVWCVKQMLLALVCEADAASIGWSPGLASQSLGPAEQDAKAIERLVRPVAYGWSSIVMFWLVPLSSHLRGFNSVKSRSA